MVHRTDWSGKYRTCWFIRQHTQNSRLENWSVLMKRKSLPSTILPKSVVTRLLILPMRFCASFWSLVADLVVSLLRVDESFPFTGPFEMDWESMEEFRNMGVEALDGWLALSPELELTDVPSVTDALSWVPMTVRLFSSIFSFEVSAFKRIRKLCSKTSCVSNPSVRTNVLVAMKRYHWKLIFLTIGPARSQMSQNHGRIEESAPPVSR